MRRKYDLRNKKSFLVIIILAIAVICIFSLFIYKYSKASRIQYIIETGSIVQDVEKNFITIEEDALLKIRWNDNYYLMYQDNKINLGKKVIVYNTVTGQMNLYGTFYEIQEDGKIVDNKDETVLANTTSSKFYKIDDREYLLVDSTIVSTDRSIEANNYILVELDKLGNAKLSNNKLNLKTITPTVLVTSKYRFDIANEILNYGKYDIDLKKIIGSTNQYLPEDTGEEEGEDGTGSGGSGSGSGGTGTGDGTGTGTGDGIGSGTGGNGNVVNNGESGDITDEGELKDKVKMTTVVSYREGLTSFDFDYVIYDPYNEYVSVFAEFMNYPEDKKQIIYLQKNETHMVIDGLIPNSDYKITFKYATKEGESEELTTETFFETELATGMPKYSISVDKYSSIRKTLRYKVNLAPDLDVYSVKVKLYFKYIDDNPDTPEIEYKEVYDDSNIEINGDMGKVIYGSFDTSKYSNFIDEEMTNIKITITEVETSGGPIKIDQSYTFRLGGGK